PEVVIGLSTDLLPSRHLRIDGDEIRYPALRGILDHADAMALGQASIVSPLRLHLRLDQFERMAQIHTERRARFGIAVTEEWKGPELGKKRWDLDPAGLDAKMADNM